jgi:uncharacterized protein YecE (DUF72 family)
VPQARWLEHFAGRFATVENNGTFYRLPAQDTFAQWAQRTPADFTMAVKASRYLTHQRRLREPAEPVARLLAAASGLGSRLGPVLVQLPPDFPVDTTRLANCLAEFRRRGPSNLRIAVEPRHDSWWTSEVAELLIEHDTALVWSDRREHPVGPLWTTCEWRYIRLHEGASNASPRYRERGLREWVDRIATNGDEPDCYVYFNNDTHAAAIQDATAFAAIARDAGYSVARTP